MDEDYYSSNYLRRFAFLERPQPLSETPSNLAPILYNLANSDGLRSDHLFNFQFDPSALSSSFHGSGTLELRKLVARDYNVTPDQVCLVTGGASLSNHHAICSILLQGGYAFVEYPHYDALESCIRISHSTNAKEFSKDHTFYINRRPEHNFQPSLDEIKEKLCKNEPRLIVFSNPHNPSGKKIDQLEQILQLVEARNGKEPDSKKHTYVLFDEVSRELPNRDTSIPCAATLSKYAISTSSTTKCFGLSGLRMGFIIADPSVIRKITSYATNTFCANSGFLEKLWLQFLKQKGPILKQLLGEREIRKSLVEESFKKVGVTYIPPDAGSNFLVKVPSRTIHGKEGIGDDIEFQAELLKQKGVAVVAGSLFHCFGYLRVSYLHMSVDNLREGLIRFGEFFSEYQSRLAHLQSNL